MELLFRKLKDRPPAWRPADAERPRSPFDATHSQTLALLNREMKQIGATAAWLQVDLSHPDGVRIDGQLRANAKVVHPGVVLTVETRERGTLVFSCDRFGSPSWQHRGSPAWHANLRAIALGLEKLRAIERYGIADQGQQFAGFAELGSGTPMGSGSMSLKEAADLLHEHSLDTVDHLLSAPEIVQRAYRYAAQRNHPDVGGDPSVFARLTEARDLLLAS